MESKIYKIYNKNNGQKFRVKWDIISKNILRKI